MTGTRSSPGTASEGKAKAALAYLLDHIVYADSYGVEGSGFQACHLCMGGGAPGIAMDHEPTCPVLRCDEIAEEWWNEKFEQQQDDLHDIIKAKDAQLFVAEQELERLRGVAQGSQVPALVAVARMAKAAAELELGSAAAPDFSPQEMLDAANAVLSSVSSTHQRPLTLDDETEDHLRAELASRSVWAADCAKYPACKCDDVCIDWGGAPSPAHRSTPTE